MRLGAIAEDGLERLALAFNRVPTPLVDTHLMFAMARTVMVAADRGVFAALADGPQDAGAVAAACGTHPRATRQLLTALAGVHYLELRGGRFALPRRLRRWLLDDGESPLLAKLRFQRFEWELVAHYDRYLETGEPAELHARLTDDDWALYQRAMRDLARLSAPEAARRAPRPRPPSGRPRRMLDLGGAHGLYAVAFCRRWPGLEADVLELPEARSAAEPLLREAAAGLAERVRHLEGDVLATDLGEAGYDLVFSSQFAHHFDAEQNRTIARAVARALRPGGIYLVQDFVRPEDAADLRRSNAGALLDLYFGATSAAGTWSAREIRSWLEGAGLRPLRVRWLRTLLGGAQVAGAKPR